MSIKSAVKFLLKNGFKETLHRIRFGERHDVLRLYDHVRLGSCFNSNVVKSAPPNTINWFISGFLASSGGHINIMRFVQKLEALGYECRIVIIDGEWMNDPESVRLKIIQAFGKLNAQVYLGVSNAPATFASIATGNNTAYHVNAFAQSKMKFYFVQDFEPWFYAQGSDYFFAEQTYKFNFIGLTAGQWLAEKLKLEYEMMTHPFGFSFDRTLYRQMERSFNEKKRVFFYARPETARRAYEIGLLALDALCRRRSNVEVVLAGSELSRYRIAFPHVISGRVKVSQLGALYNSCDVGLVLSMTNASLLPLELMACGTPIVSNTGPWVEWLLSEKNAKLATLDFVDLANALESVLFDDKEWQRLHLAGLHFAESTSWDTEAQKVAAALSLYGCQPS